MNEVQNCTKRRKICIPTEAYCGLQGTLPPTIGRRQHRTFSVETNRDGRSNLPLEVSLSALLGIVVPFTAAIQNSLQELRQVVCSSNYRITSLNLSTTQLRKLSYYVFLVTSCVQSSLIFCLFSLFNFCVGMASRYTLLLYILGIASYVCVLLFIQLI